MCLYPNKVYAKPRHGVKCWKVLRVILTDKNQINIVTPYRQFPVNIKKPLKPQKRYRGHKIKPNNRSNYSPVSIEGGYIHAYISQHWAVPTNALYLDDTNHYDISVECVADGVKALGTSEYDHRLLWQTELICTKLTIVDKEIHKKIRAALKQILTRTFQVA